MGCGQEGTSHSFADRVAEHPGEVVTDVVSTAGDAWWRTVSSAGDAWDYLTRDVQDWVDREPLEQRESHCAAEGGQWVEEVDVSACEAGVVQISFNGKVFQQSCDQGTGDLFEFQCVHVVEPDTVYFNDGPSVPHAMHKASRLLGEEADTLLWTDLFWEAGVNHDYCYHHGNATHQFSQQDCDNQMLNDLMAICEAGNASDASWFTRDVCTRNAHGIFAALRYYGEEAFAAMDSRVDYPEYVPMYKKLQLAEQPIDAEMRDAIERPFD